MAKKKRNKKTDEKIRSALIDILTSVISGTILLIIEKLISR